MRLNHPFDLRDMLGAAGAATSDSGGSGRSELLGRIAGQKARLPHSVQSRLPSDLASTLLFLAYAGTALAGLGGIVQAVGDPDAVPLTVLAALYLLAGLAGLLLGRNLFVLIPAVVLWLVAAQASLFSS